MHNLVPAGPLFFPVPYVKRVRVKTDTENEAVLFKGESTSSRDPPRPLNAEFLLTKDLTIHLGHLGL